MPAMLQGAILFVVGCVVVYGMIACIGSAQGGHDKPHHGHH